MRSLLFSLALLGGAVSTLAHEPAVRVEGAWARASVQGQSGTGAFMTLTARGPLALVGVSTPVAGVAELHEMKLEGDVMKMRGVDALALPAGRAVVLKPGGYHLMLMELRMPLQPGTSIPVTLHLRDAQGAVSRLEVPVPVAVRPPAGAPAAAHKH